MSSAARPTMDERLRAIGWSSRYFRYSSEVSPATRDSRNTSPSRRNSWAACAPHSRAAYSRTVSSTAPGLATSRPSAARISRLAADCSRASRNAWRSAGRRLIGRVVPARRCSTEARGVLDACSLGSAIVSPVETLFQFVPYWLVEAGRFGYLVGRKRQLPAFDDRDRGPCADVDAIAVGQWGFFAVSEAGPRCR